MASSARTRLRKLATGVIATISINRLALRKVRARAQAQKRRLQLRGDQLLDSLQAGTLKDSIKEAGHIGLDGLRDEAAHSGWVAEVLDAVDEAAGEIAEVESAEGVYLSRVAADLAVGGVRGALLGGGGDDVGGSPLVVLGALVVVVGDTLVAVSVLKRAVRGAFVSPQRQEVVGGHDASWVGG